MKDTELQAVVDIVEDNEGSAEEDEVLAADQDASVAVGLPVVPAQVESGIVLLAGWESEEHVQSEASVVQTAEESGVQSVEKSGF